MRPRDLPMEYRLLGVIPGKWEPIYSLSFFSKMALTLAFNDATYNRLAAQAKVGRAAADALYPDSHAEPIQPNGRRVLDRCCAIPAPAPRTSAMPRLPSTSRCRRLGGVSERMGCTWDQ